MRYWIAATYPSQYSSGDKANHYLNVYIKENNYFDKLSRTERL